MSTTIEGSSPLRYTSAVLVAAEAVALAVIAVWVVVDPVAGADSGAMAAAISGLAALAAVALGWAAIGLWRGRTWPRGLALTWQVMQAAVGFTVLEWSLSMGLAAVIVAVAATILLVADARGDAKASDDRTTGDLTP